MRAPSSGDTALGEVLLAVEDVSLSFGGVRALTAVSFDIRKGEIRAIIGPNGAGKTSMLNVVNGFYQPQSGRITFKGEARNSMRPYAAARGGIARTFQNLALFRGMTTLDNILAGRSLKMRRGFFWQVIRHGPALAMEPDLLLLDEPMAGMNLEEKEDMSRFIIDVNQQYGTTIALIEHDMGVVMDLSDRVVVLDYGRKIADAVPDEVKKDENVIRAYLGQPHGVSA